MSEQLVLNAVRTEHTGSLTGLLQRLFALWFDAFVYNQIWEDPSVDIEALRIDSNSNILTIASGGCNVLNYLIERPSSITAVDLNRHHIHLLELKLAAVNSLPRYEDFFTLFGAGKGTNAEKLFDRHIAAGLDDTARRYWSGRRILGRRFNMFSKTGLYRHSRNGRFLGFFHWIAHLTGSRPERILSASSIEEQEILFQRFIEPFFNNVFVRAVGRLPVTMFGLGIPPQQFTELKKDINQNGTLLDLYRERVRRLACNFPISENYFAWQAFARKYDTVRRLAVPEYLKEGNYERLRELTPRVRTSVGSVASVIEKQPPGIIDRFVLLDAQDWMTTESIINLWRLIARKGACGSRIIFRTAGKLSPVENALPLDLRKRFSYESDESLRLFRLDRAALYGGFHLYTLR